MSYTRRIPYSGLKTLQNNWKRLNYSKARLIQWHLQSAGTTCIRRSSERANDVRICIRQKSIAIRKHHRITRQQQIIIIVHISVLHNTKFWTLTTTSYVLRDYSMSPRTASADVNQMWGLLRKPFNTLGRHNVHSIKFGDGMETGFRPYCTAHVRIEFISLARHILIKRNGT